MYWALKVINIFENLHKNVCEFGPQLSLAKMTGLSDRLMQKQMEGSNAHAKCNKSPYNEIKFENITVAFLILATGILIAIFTLMFECIRTKLMFSSAYVAKWENKCFILQ